MKFDIIRAWKDEAYRASLNEEQLAVLPANPIGEVELSDSDLAGISGGGTKWSHRHHRHHRHHHHYSYWHHHPHYDWDDDYDYDYDHD
jgi:mersacidin/lichenicidin family type 2 lantibiotic